MDIILYYIRDNIVSVHYFIYAFVCFFLMFALIGYLYKQKYAKVEIKLNSSQTKKEEQGENTVAKNTNQINEIGAQQTSQSIQQVNNSQIFPNPETTNNVQNINNNQTINPIPSTVTSKTIPNNANQTTTLTPLPNQASNVINPQPMPNQAPNVINPQPIPNPTPIVNVSQTVSNQSLQNEQKADLK